MAAHQAAPSLGFSRQEHWRGLPFSSPMHESEKWKWSRSVMSDSSRPQGQPPTRLLCPWDFPGKSTGVGRHCLLHTIFLDSTYMCSVIDICFFSFWLIHVRCRLAPLSLGQIEVTWPWHKQTGFSSSHMKPALTRGSKGVPELYLHTAVNRGCGHVTTNGYFTPVIC